MSLLPINPGDQVFVLCCGTGLETFIAAKMVGSHGLVVGADVSDGMLGEAAARHMLEKDLASIIRFVKHDVKDLDNCDALDAFKGQFDFAICSNSFVLFDDPAEVVRGLVEAKGRLVVDIPHEKSLPHGLVLEKVAKDRGLEFPSDRQWVKDKDSFKRVLEAEDMVVEKFELLEYAMGSPVTHFPVENAAKHFDFATMGSSTGCVWEGADVDKARELFKRECEKIAVDGKVEIVDALYL